jgi:hypothetical protein
VVKCRLKLGNAYYHSLQNLLPFHLHPKNLKLKYKKLNRNACRVLVVTPEGKKPLGAPNISGKMILRWILKNRMEWYELY